MASVACLDAPVDLDESQHGLLSVVITSYTDERLRDIFELLDALKEQTYPDIEIVYVVERSPELYSVIKEYAASIGLANNRIIFNEGEQGLSAARNLGIKHAKGDVVAFLDDDALPFPEWGEAVVSTFEDESIIGATGPAIPLWEDESMSWFPKEFQWIVGSTAFFNCNEMKDVRNVWGMNQSFRKEAFKVGGLFPRGLGMWQSNRGKWNIQAAEEVELSLRVTARTGKRIVYNPRMRVRHRVYKNKIAWRSIAHTSYMMIGYSKRMLKKAYPEDGTGSKVLNTEHELLRRIILKLLPSIAKDAVVHPRVAWKRFSVMAISLSFVGLGYTANILQDPLGHRKLIIE